MTCWAACCLPQPELLILHVHHTCVSVHLVRMEWPRCAFNERSETPFISDCQWISVITICSQLQTVSGRNISSLLLCAVDRDIWKTQVRPVPAILSYLQIRVSELEMSAKWKYNQPADYNSAAVHASFTLHLSADSEFSVQLTALSILHFLFHWNLSNKKTLKQYAKGPTTERHHSEDIRLFHTIKWRVHTTITEEVMEE